jgi:prepilin-type N-terminal cleavage/methylation domain-containing protein
MRDFLFPVSYLPLNRRSESSAGPRWQWEMGGGRWAMARRKRATRSGFTLPEVLAALVFVGIVLPVVMRGISISMQASRSARHHVEAAQLAKQKIDEFLIVRDPSAFISASGDFGTGWEEYNWTSAAQLGDDGVYDVLVSVQWTEQAREKSVSLSTMVYPSTTVTTETGGTP